MQSEKAGTGASAGLEPRLAALRLLQAVLSDDQLLAQALQDPARGLSGLSPSDRARAQRLATETLRHLVQCDAVLAPFLRKAPPASLRNILRLGVMELVLDPSAAHGIVNAAVTVARREKGGAALSGLVNAVLRKIAATPDPFAGMPPALLPQWLRKPLIRAYGEAGVQAIEAAHAGPVPTDLTVRSGRPAELPMAVVLPTGSLRLLGSVQVSALPGYAQGDWWVQDAAAALPARLLDVRRGERVLDLCAAPGGKTLQLADAGGDVTALDMSDSRMGRLRDNLARTGLTARIVIADALQWVPDGQFDAILLDAPCSATGTMRRHPDLAHVKDGSDLPGLQALQGQLIDRALGWLKPGGRLVYATCSLMTGEGEAQIAAALERHAGLRVERAVLPGIPEAWIAPQGGLRLRPDYWGSEGGMDGFFMARLCKD
jgi:16S rRNA (cytosine967-C5)-methyltransferase